MGIEQARDQLSILEKAQRCMGEFFPASGLRPDGWVDITDNMMVPSALDAVSIWTLGAKMQIHEHDDLVNTIILHDADVIERITVHDFQPVAQTPDLIRNLHGVTKDMLCSDSTSVWVYKAPSGKINYFIKRKFVFQTPDEGETGSWEATLLCNNDSNLLNRAFGGDAVEITFPAEEELHENFSDHSRVVYRFGEKYYTQIMTDENMSTSTVRKIVAMLKNTPLNIQTDFLMHVCMNKLFDGFIDYEPNKRDRLIPRAEAFLRAPFE